MSHTIAKAEPSKNNKIIADFFRGRTKNARGEEWFRPSENKVMPQKVREITKALETFFSKKRWYNGGPIPDELLYTKRNYHLMNNITLLDAVEIDYDSIDECKTLAKTPYKKNVEIAITMRVIRECEKKHVPQDYIAGCLLLYLELCEKVVLL